MIFAKKMIEGWPTWKKEIANLGNKKSDSVKLI